MRPLFIGLALALTAAPQAHAQQDLQRCVWSCLYGPGKGNPASPAYNQCVANRCAEGGGPGQSASATIRPAQPSQSWSAGAASGGARFAGIDFPGSEGRRGLYYFCDGRGRHFLEVVGDNAALETYHLVIDGRSYSFLFRKGPRGHLRVAIDGNAPVLRALSGGSSMSIRYNDAVAVPSVSLRGSARALASARRGC